MGMGLCKGVFQTGPPSKEDLFWPAKYMVMMLLVFLLLLLMMMMLKMMMMMMMIWDLSIFGRFDLGTFSLAG